MEQSIRLCLAYKKEDDTQWEQVSFISSSLGSILSGVKPGKEGLVNDNLRVIHSREPTDSPVDKCSFTTFDTEKNGYDNGWKITQMFFFEGPNKFSIYFQRPFKIQQEVPDEDKIGFVEFDKKTKYNVIMNYGVYSDPNGQDEKFVFGDKIDEP